ncbi:MAG: energy transducer TonB [Pseudomonadota bacterium]
MRGVFIGTLLAIVIATSSLAKEEPAKPHRRVPPKYPLACMPPDGESAPDAHVTLAFQIAKTGFPEKVRIMESSNPCFDEVALKAVEGWVYRPRLVDGVQQIQPDVETTITFRFDSETAEDDVTAQDFDARPIKRIPPNYPDRCQRSATRRETVFLEYDVTAKGRTENIRVIDTTNACFNTNAARSVQKWRFKPRMRDGVPVRRPNVQTSIAFELAGGPVQPEMRIRPKVRTALKKSNQDIQKFNKGKSKKSADEILAALNAIQEQFGEDFSLRESDLFYRLRSGMYLELENYRAARDDLLIVQRLQLLDLEMRKPLDDYIKALDAHIAQEDAEQAAEE